MSVHLFPERFRKLGALFVPVAGEPSAPDPEPGPAPEPAPENVTPILAHAPELRAGALKDVLVGLHNAGYRAIAAGNPEIEAVRIPETGAVVARIAFPVQIVPWETFDPRPVEEITE